MTNEFPNKTASNRGRESPEKVSRPKKQTKISNYWLGNSEPSTSENSNSNRFEIFNTIEQENENDQTKDKYPKPMQIFIDCVSNILVKSLYGLLDNVVKDFYDLKIINSDQVKIQSKISEAFQTVVRELESKNTQFYTKSQNRRAILKFSLEIPTRQLRPQIRIKKFGS